MEIRYDQGSMTAETVVKHLFLHGGAETVIRECILRREALREGKQLGIEIPDDRLQSFADAFRIARNLHHSQDMLDFLEGKGLSVEDFEQYCEESLMLETLRERLADKDAVRAYFLNHRSRFDRARLSIITVEDESLADELAMRITEDGDDFHALAREYSVNEYCHAGGYAGPAKRGSFPPEMEARIFSANAGDVLGPFPESGRHHLLLVEETIKAEMNEATVAEIKEQIFHEWSARFFKTGVQATN